MVEVRIIKNGCDNWLLRWNPWDSNWWTQKQTLCSVQLNLLLPDSIVSQSFAKGFDQSLSLLPHADVKRKSFKKNVSPLATIFWPDTLRLTCSAHYFEKVPSLNRTYLRLVELTSVYTLLLQIIKMMIWRLQNMMRIQKPKFLVSQIISANTPNTELNKTRALIHSLYCVIFQGLWTRQRCMCQFIIYRPPWLHCIRKCFDVSF